MKTTPITMLATMALLATLSASSASAQQRVDQERPAPADGAVDIFNLSGSVRVVGWNKNAVAVTGTLGEGVERLEFGGDSLQTTVRVVIRKNARNTEDSNMEVRVPEGSRVRTRTTSADIEVSKVIGPLDLNAVSGDLRVSDSPREVVVNAVSGDVDLSISSARVRARTVSGEITLRGAQGDVEVTTVNGEVRAEGGQFERGKFSTINGEIHFDGDLKPNGVFQFDTVNGCVDLLLPASIRADFQVSAKGICNEFGPNSWGDRSFGPQGQSQDGYYPFGSEAQGSRNHGPPRNLSFSTGGSGASVTISTFNGSVNLRKKK